MNVLEIIREAGAHQQETGRMSLRVLRRQYSLDDDALEEVEEGHGFLERAAVARQPSDEDDATADLMEARELFTQMGVTGRDAYARSISHG